MDERVTIDTSQAVQAYLALEKATKQAENAHKAWVATMGNSVRVNISYLVAQQNLAIAQRDSNKALSEAVAVKREDAIQAGINRIAAERFAEAVDRETASIRRQIPELERRRQASIAMSQQLHGNVSAFMLNNMAAPRAMTTATPDEAIAYRQAVIAYREAAVAARLSYSQQKQLANDWRNATVSSYSGAKFAALQAYGQMMQAASRLGTTQQSLAEQARQAAEEQRKQGIDASTSYDKQGKAANHLLLTWHSIFRLIQVQVFHMLLGRSLSMIIDATRRLADFQIQISQIRTISFEAQRSTEAWTSSVLKLSSAYGKAADDVAQGLYQLISNQVAKGTEAIQFMNEALMFSRVAFSSTEDAVDLGSAAIKAFGLSTTEAEAVFANFMATVEYGRVQAFELSNTWGRVGALGHQLGMSIAEINAAIAFLTVRGINADEAMTQLSGIMQKLIKPTEIGERILAKWGVTSGRAAVETFNFMGVLQKLFEEGEKSEDSLAFLGEFFNRVRAIRGAAALIGTNELKEYVSTVDKLNNSLAEYKAKKIIATESPAFVMQQQLQEFRNIMMTDFAQPLMMFFKRMADEGHGLVYLLNQIRSGVEPLILSIKLGVGIFNAFGMSVRDAITLLTIVVGATKVFGVTVQAQGTQAIVTLSAFGRTIKQVTTESAAMTTATIASMKSLQMQSSIILTIVGSAIAAYIQTRKEVELLNENARTTIKGIYEELQSANSQIVKQDKTTIENRTQLYKDSVDKLSKLHTQFISQLLAGLNLLGDKHREIFSKIANEAKRAFDSTIKDISETLKDAERKNRSLLTQLERTADFIRDQQFNLEDKSFERRFKLVEQTGTPNKLIKILQEQEQMIFGKVLSNYANKNIEEGRKYHNEYVKLLEREYELWLKIGEEEGYSVTVKQNLARLSGLIDFTIKDQVTAEQNIARIQKIAAEKEKATLEQKQQLLEDTKNILEDIRQLVPGVSDTPQKVAQKFVEFQDKRKEIVKLFQGLGSNVPAEITKQLNNEETIIKHMIQYAELRKKVVDAEKAITEEKEKQNKYDLGLLENQKRTEDAIKILFENTLKLSKVLPQIQLGGSDVYKMSGGSDYIGTGSWTTWTVKMSEEDKKKFADIYGIFPGIGDGFINFNLQEIANKLTDIVRKYELLKTQPQTDETRKQTSDWAKEITHYMEFLQKVTPTELAKTGELPMISQITGIVNAFQNIVDSLPKYELDRIQSDKITADAQKQIVETNEKLKRLTIPLDEKLLNTEENLVKAIDNLTIVFQEYLKRTGGKLGMASGGMLYGGISGKDSIPIMAMPGEFIINANAARKYLPLLDAINRGENLGTLFRWPKMQGTVVTGNSTTVGDIHVSVQGGNSSAQTVQEIGKALRREIRRGTVIL